jgi:lincosamide nucleotidyltransferase B/F
MDQASGRLLRRLEAIGSSLARFEFTVGLIGLGSSGAEGDRLDEFSDLDFFVIVEPGQKDRLIGDLGWLEDAFPIAFSFRNTVDGHKVLFEDGIYAEFAVFTPDELPNIPATAARVVWAKDGERARQLSLPQAPADGPLDREFLVGEILTNLYVGLMRLRRGEVLSAHRFIQGHAVGSLLRLWPALREPASPGGDPFDETRRFETRFPGSGTELAGILQGYRRSAESAMEILAFLERHVPVDSAMKRRILEASRTSG